MYIIYLLHICTSLCCRYLSLMHANSLVRLIDLTDFFFLFFHNQITRLYSFCDFPPPHLSVLQYSLYRFLKSVSGLYSLNRQEVLLWPQSEGCSAITWVIIGKYLPFLGHQFPSSKDMRQNSCVIQKHIPPQALLLYRQWSHSGWVGRYNNSETGPWLLKA